uniref:Uncharacterized protein n=1 Tax=Populus trichocarpa TaxID=3694 RepID=A9P9T8_POPTR|nr:unknown [Populus trichocarpa]
MRYTTRIREKLLQRHKCITSMLGMNAPSMSFTFVSEISTKPCTSSISSLNNPKRYLLGLLYIGKCMRFPFFFYTYVNKGCED